MTVLFGATVDGRVQLAEKIATEIAEPAAAEVDRLARFPHETIDALRSERMLSELVPSELGGEAAPLERAAAIAAELGRHCSSAAMVYAMHQMQVACLVRHGRNGALRDFLAELADRQLLLGSATTEAGIGGSLRTSSCAVELEEDRFRLEKNAPVISYGQHADALLVTARRTPESPASDQVLVLCRTPGLELEPTSGWDTLGFRGTCSLGFMLRASGEANAILDDPFGDIASETMLPVSHILWSSVWLGIARSALKKARGAVRAEAHRHPGTTPPGALHLAELTITYKRFADSVRAALAEYAPFETNPNERTGLGFAIAMNGLKVFTSRTVVEIVGRAMEICGIASYREDSPMSLGRHLRDAHGAALMVNNDRLLANNAQMLLIHKEP